MRPTKPTEREADLVPSGAQEKPPHPATVAQRRTAPRSTPAKPPHPATVAQRRAAPPSTTQRPPHPATVAQRRAAPPSTTQRPPHPATVAQRRATPPSTTQRPPHPATVAQRRAAPPAAPQKPPHPATVAQRRAAPPSAAAKPPHPATLPRPARAGAGPRAAQRMLAPNPVAALKTHADNLKLLANGQEIQILRFDNRFYISTNEYTQSDALKSQNNAVVQEFANEPGPPQSITWAGTPENGAIKATDIVGIHGGQEEPATTHAEQRLLLCLAERLKNGTPPTTNVIVGGNKQPCTVCSKDLTAFKRAFDGHFGGVNIEHAAVAVRHANNNPIELPEPGKDDNGYAYWAFVKRFNLERSKL